MLLGWTLTSEACSLVSPSLPAPAKSPSFLRRQSHVCLPCPESESFPFRGSIGKEWENSWNLMPSGILCQKKTNLQAYFLNNHSKRRLKAYLYSGTWLLNNNWFKFLSSFYCSKFNIFVSFSWGISGYGAKRVSRGSKSNYLSTVFRKPFALHEPTPFFFPLLFSVSFFMVDQSSFSSLPQTSQTWLCHCWHSEANNRKVNTCHHTLLIGYCDYHLMTNIALWLFLVVSWSSHISCLMTIIALWLLFGSVPR